MKTIITIAALLFTTPSFANSFVCEMVNSPNVSKLRIDYDNNTAENVYLQSPKSDNWRLMDLNVIQVLGGAFDDHELLSVQPKEIANIDWSKVPECFAEIGSQWFFTFNRDLEKYNVQLMPYFQTKSNACVTPKFRAQPKKMNCEWIAIQNNND